MELHSQVVRSKKCVSRKSGRTSSEVVYSLVNIQKAIEHGPVEIVDLSINSMVIFYSV